MTTTQNVTELQPRMTREQLIDAARKAAPLLPPAYRGIMTELANRLDVTSVALCESMQQRSVLAVENTILRDDVTCWAKECDRIVERHTKKRTNMHLLEAQKELREITPATDIVITEIKQSGIPEGWKLVPEQMYLEAEDIESICAQCGDGGKNYGDFTNGILWVGEVSQDDGWKYGLHQPGGYARRRRGVC
ncbi:hypothetical protein ACUOCP_11070 [Escherichia sp. R-CC3]